MRFLHRGVLALLPLVFMAPVFAQTSAPQEPPAVEDSTPGRNIRPRHLPPCWKQAGMTPDMVNQQWKIEDQGKTRIAAACNETSTSAQQKHDQIQQINLETEQAIAKLIPAKQLQVYKACQADLAKKRPKSPNQKELGPCGGIIPSTPSGSNEPHMDH